MRGCTTGQAGPYFLATIVSRFIDKPGFRKQPLQGLKGECSNAVRTYESGQGPPNRKYLLREPERERSHKHLSMDWPASPSMVDTGVGPKV